MSNENVRPSEEAKAEAQPPVQETEATTAEATGTAAAPEQDFDEYVKAMAALREGGRPILCW